MIGRIRERDILHQCAESKNSEFVALYGRRRVGKTYLVKEFFGGSFTFYATGILNERSGMEAQLENFNDEIVNYGGEDLPRARNWRDAFANLNKLVERASCKGKKIIFLDEIPWMATVNSDFLPALDYFWNRWASSRHDVLLIICGSATSWIIDKIVDNRGGLHNRLTRQIALSPFTLSECEEYYRDTGIVMTRYQMVEAYMIFGGIPYYMSLMNPGYDLFQNVDMMYFNENALLRNEYDNLYNSLFRDAKNHILVVEALASKGIGMTREDIIRATGLTNGGSLTRILRQLEQSGFIRVYLAFGNKEKDKLYQLIDAFTLFHLRFNKGRKQWTEDYWIKYSATPAHNTWSGYAFEKVCLLHLPQIKRKLGISGVLTGAYAWRSGKQESGGAQIDLVIDRNDHVINLCEMKFFRGEYDIDKKEDAALRNRRAAFESGTKTRKAVRTTIVTTFGLKRTAYASEYNSVVLLDDLFEDAVY
ncbi:MAG: AAA family ATPase [Clostridiales Family XIII bacterium]|nr:AAA family ATPase [Clostridiales Family XIII bacterium]